MFITNLSITTNDHNEVISQTPVTNTSIICFSCIILNYDYGSWYNNGRNNVHKNVVLFDREEDRSGMFTWLSW